MRAFRTVRFVALAVLCVLVLARRSLAQSFNIDFGSSAHPLPPSTFGGGANQPGVWNSVDESSVPAFSRQLVDLAGQLTPAFVTVTKPFGSGALIADVHATPLTGGEAALFDDSVLWFPAPAQATIQVTITGLVPGSYDICCYAGSPVQEGGFYGACAACCFSYCTLFDGTFTEFSAYRKLCCSLSTTLTLTCDACGSPLSYPAIDGLQLTFRAFGCGSTGTQAYCTSGVLPACACPCGNCGGSDRGCENSYATGGGRLSVGGTPDVSADTFVLQASSLPPAAPALFFQGTDVTGGGCGAPFQDGTLCVGGTVARLGIRIATSGTCAFGAGQPGDPLVSVSGGVPSSGGTRYYQAWYRDSQVFCTSATSNLTGAYRVVWVP